MSSVGSSTVIGGRATGLSKSAMVSPMSTPSRPTTAQMSPAATSSVSTRPRRSKTYSWATVSSMRRPSCLSSAIALALADLAGDHPADGDAADVIAVVERDDQHLQRARRRPPPAAARA